jgi:hypothetical protein
MTDIMQWPGRVAVSLKENNLFFVTDQLPCLNAQLLWITQAIFEKVTYLASFAMAFPVGPLLAASVAPSHMNLKEMGTLDAGIVAEIVL